MAPGNAVPLGAGFYPDWWHKQYGISFDKKYHFDPETRIEARLAMDKALHQRFGDVGMGETPIPGQNPLSPQG
jgi:hypothetical protein